MLATGYVTVRCPACQADVELPAAPTQKDRGRTITLSVDLQPATDHILTHASAEAP